MKDALGRRRRVSRAVDLVTMETGLLMRKTRVALTKERGAALQRWSRVSDGQRVVEVAGQVIRIGNWGLFIFVSCAFGAGVAACKQTEPMTDRAPAGGMRPAARPPDASPAPDGGKAGSEVAADPSATLENLVVFITERSRLPLAVADAEERLRFLGPIRREEQPAGELPAVLTLFWERAPGLRVQVEYQFDGAWKFQSAGCDVTDPSGIAAPTYKRLFTMIRRRLGKPAWKEPQQGRLSAVGWKLGHRIELVLSEEVGSPPTGGPSTNYVSISISEPEGEPD
jgi:hypothetical protein